MKQKKWYVLGIGLIAILASLYSVNQFSTFEDATWIKLIVLLSTIIVGSIGLALLFTAKQYVLNTSRIFVGIVFIFSGFVKAVDPLGSKYKFIDYFEAWNIDFLAPTALTFGLILSTIELVVGLALLFKILPKYSSILSLIFMAIFTPVTFYLALQQNVSGKELVHDCGCFGDALVLTNWQTFIKNIVILLPVLFIVIYRNKFTEPQSKSYSYRIVLAFTLAVLGLSSYALQHLPPIDFRPYKKGTKLVNEQCSDIQRQSNSITYQYGEFVNKKTGERKEYDIVNNYPADWETWEYDATKGVRTVVVEKEPVKDSLPKEKVFFVDNMLFSQNGEDFTCNIVTDTSFVLLVIQYDIKTTDISNQKRINELYDWSQKQGIAFYGASSSLDSDILEYRKRSAAKYVILSADDIPLKTIVRANPGLVLLKNGVVIDNWHGSDIPSIQFFAKILK